MKRVLRYTALWAPLILSVKNWVVDVIPVTEINLQPVSCPDKKINDDWAIVQKYRVRMFQDVARGDVVLVRWG